MICFSLLYSTYPTYVLQFYFYACFSFCIFVSYFVYFVILYCFCIGLFIVSHFVLSVPILYMSTDHCHQMEIQLQ
jgi:hypothetical protein